MIPSLPLFVVRRAACAGLLIACAWGGAVWPFASRADEPLQLGSEHIGMTAEGLSEAQPAPPVQPPSADAVQSEWNAVGSGEDPWASLDEHGSGGPAVTNYDDCVELAVKMGNGFSAASGVCQALFPEPGEANATAPPSPRDVSPDATEPRAAAEASASEEPLVLRLHGTPASDPEDDVDQVEDAEIDQADAIDEGAEGIAVENAPADG